MKTRGVKITQGDVIEIKVRGYGDWIILRLMLELDDQGDDTLLLDFCKSRVCAYDWSEGAARQIADRLEENAAIAEDNARAAEVLRDLAENRHLPESIRDGWRRHHHQGDQYLKGVRDAQAGAPRSACPYEDRVTPTGTTRWDEVFKRAWYDGWDDWTALERSRR